MAQIIKHRRGSLESLSAVTSSLQKGEIVIASGSSNLTVTNGASVVFAVAETGQVQAINRFLMEHRHQIRLLLERIMDY